MAFEEIINCTNLLYRQRGLALVQKIPTNWLPIRDRCGQIVSAKVEHKSGVDYMGVWEHGAIAFEAKSTLNKKRWSLNNLKQEQLQFLRDHSLVNANARQFVLLAFLSLNKCFLLDLDFIENRWDEWKKGGRGSLSVSELKNMPSLPIDYPLDYLQLLAFKLSKAVV
jgi:recombination protein U